MAIMFLVLASVDDIDCVCLMVIVSFVTLVGTPNVGAEFAGFCFSYLSKLVVRYTV